MLPGKKGFDDFTHRRKLRFAVRQRFVTAALFVDGCEHIDLFLCFEYQIVCTGEFRKVSAHFVDLFVDRTGFEHMVANKFRQIADGFEGDGLVKEVERLLVANSHNPPEEGAVLFERIEYFGMGLLLETLFEIANIGKIEKILFDRERTL